MNAQALPLRIDWSETDQLGHVNNVAIVKYCQSARVEYLAHVGLPVFPGMKTGPIEAATTVQFRSQLHYPGNVVVYTRVLGAKTTSLVLEHRIVDGAGRVAVRAEEVIVHFDFEKQTKIPLTDAIRAAMAAYDAACTPQMPEL